jgi:SAM-dependent methyltransferase
VAAATVAGVSQADPVTVLDDVRASYDTAAVAYRTLVRDVLVVGPVDRALLDDFAARVLAAGGGPVADVGCGPGVVTSSLADRGLDVRGVDLSPRMVELARQDHPHLRFEVGTMTALPFADGELAGVLAWWSIFHTPPERLPALFGEFRRVLAPGGHALVGFHAGDDEYIHSRHAYGHDVSLHAWLLSPDGVAAAAESAGLEVRLRLVTAPEGRQRNPQARLGLRRPVGA